MIPGLLLFGMALDAMIGEPKALWSKVPHPAVLMGRAVTALEARYNTGDNRERGGRIALGILVIGAGLIGLVLALLPGGPLWQALGAAILLSQRSLVEHVRSVANAFPAGLDAARAEVGKIVGRDVSALDESGVASAAIESGAENFSDGVVAPALWFLLLGLPGMLIYKAVNTADSMIGHRTERHEAFGRATAKLDDLLNFVPARLSALFIALAAVKPQALLVAVREAKGHASPNAGWPEAAMAAALGLRLGGPRRYAGDEVDGVWLNAGAERGARITDIAPAIGLIWRAWAVALLCVAVVWVW